MSLEVRTVTVCLFVHMSMCARQMDGHRERKRYYLSTMAGDGIRRTDLWRERDKREGERAIESGPALINNCMSNILYKDGILK